MPRKLVEVFGLPVNAAEIRTFGQTKALVVERFDRRLTLTPLYDVLTAQPSLEARQIEKKRMKLAMSVGDNRHYVLDRIAGRHIRQTAKRAGVPEPLVNE